MSSIIALPTVSNNTTTLTDKQYENLTYYVKEFFVEQVGKFNIVTYIKKDYLKREVPHLAIYSGGESSWERFEFAPTHEGLDEMYQLIDWLRVLLMANLSLEMKERNKQLRILFKKAFGKEFKFSIRKRHCSSISIECKETPLSMAKKEYPEDYWGAKEFKSALTTAFQTIVSSIAQSGACYHDTADYGSQPSFYAFFSWAR